jgi:hypothetical protein
MYNSNHFRLLNSYGSVGTKLLSFNKNSFSSSFAPLVQILSIILLISSIYKSFHVGLGLCFPQIIIAQSSELIATLSPFGLIEGQKLFDQISSQ